MKKLLISLILMALLLVSTEAFASYDIGMAANMTGLFGKNTNTGVIPIQDDPIIGKLLMGQSIISSSGGMPAGNGGTNIWPNINYLPDRPPSFAPNPGGEGENGVPAIPEPTTILLLGLGFAGAGLLRRKR